MKALLPFLVFLLPAVLRAAVLPQRPGNGLAATTTSQPAARKADADPAESECIRQYRLGADGTVQTLNDSECGQAGGWHTALLPDGVAGRLLWLLLDDGDLEQQDLARPDDDSTPAQHSSRKT